MKLKFYQVFLCLILGAGAALAQTTEISYQGKLDDGGNPANATYDMQFRLFDNPGAGQGTQQGSTVTKPTVSVAGGIFTVQLDFGSAAFASGADRYLEISIRPAGSTGGYTALAPRQKLTTAPYSIKSLTANSATTATDSTQLGGLPASQYVKTNDSRLSDPRTPLAGNGSYIQNTSSPQTASNFNISGTGSADILNATSGFNLKGVTVFATSNASNSSVFVGFGTGTQEASGLFNVIFGSRAGTVLTTGGFNTFIGSDSGRSTTTGTNNIFLGYNVGSENVTGSNNTILGGYLGGANLSFATAIGQGATVATSNTLVLGRNQDVVRIPGNLNISAPGGGTGPLCLNAITFYVALCSSSIRYKTNIAPYRPGLDLVNRLEPVTFNWKETNLADFGLVAEEVEKVEPLLVTYNREGVIEGVKYDRVAVVLLNAVRQQQEQISAQEKQLAEQKEINQRLQNQIEMLTKLICRSNPTAEGCRLQGEKP